MKVPPHPLFLMHSIPCLLTLTLLLLSPPTSYAEDSWYLQDIRIPGNLNVSPDTTPLTIAIVDDGIRLTHQTLQGFIWTNPREIPGNRRDDDGNGHIDDIHGWDFGDNDPDVAAPSHRTADFYHGTHIASIITRIAQEAYGKEATKVLQIMPIKTLSDASPTTYLKQAYSGIEYALENGADIILCAWGQNVISPHDQAILDKALDLNIPIIAASGNIPEEREQFPAAHPAAISVCAHDELGQKTATSTYGGFVDLSAPGENITAASSTTDHSTETHSGTSQATAIVTAALAILKQQHPDHTWTQLKAALINSTTTTTQNPAHSAKMGSGKLHLTNALIKGYTQPSTTLLQAKAYIPQNTATPTSWTIGPLPGVSGVRTRIASQPTSTHPGTFHFYEIRPEGDTPFGSYSAQDLQQAAYVPGNHIRITYQPNSTPPSTNEILLHYASDPINYSTLYCSGTQYRDQPGIITDGSESNYYSLGTDAKWIITAPEGKQIQFKFHEFDTEPKVDKLYLFNGNGTHEKIMAIYTGSKIPSDLTSWTNQALIWFVTDGQNQAQGWKVEYTFIDP